MAVGLRMVVGFGEKSCPQRGHAVGFVRLLVGWIVCTVYNLAAHR